MTADSPEAAGPSTHLPIQVGLVLAAFPREKMTAFKYFLLLLNRLQRTFEFAFYHAGPDDDPFCEWLRSGRVLDADRTRDHLVPFAERLRCRADEAIAAFDLSKSYPSQLIIVRLVALSNTRIGGR